LNYLVQIVTLKNYLVQKRMLEKIGSEASDKEMGVHYWVGEF
jgi:hypothetical protein